MHCSSSVDEKGIFHFSANSFTPSVRPATDTISTPSILARAWAWISPMAPVPARQIFIKPPKRVVSAPVEPHRVLYQELPLQISGRGDVRNIVDQQAVVRHVVLEVRVRPIGAPQHAI